MMTVAQPVRPKVHESLIGFLMRLAEANGFPSHESLLQLVQGSANKPPSWRQTEELAVFCRCTIAEMEQLFGFELRMSDGTSAWRLGSEWLTKRNFVTSRAMACCPMCLEEDAYLPGAWELTFYRSCAWHRVALIHHCPACLKPLRWSRQKLYKCNCGYDFRDADPIRCSDSSWLVAQLIEHRLDPDWQFDVPIGLSVDVAEKLAGLTLDGLCKTLWFLGHCVADFDGCQSGHGRVLPRADQFEQIIERAMALLGDWPDSFCRSLRGLANRRGREHSGSLYERLYGPVAAYFESAMSGDELCFVRLAYEHEIRAIWREMGKPPPSPFDRQYEFLFEDSSCLA